MNQGVPLQRPGAWLMTRPAGWPLWRLLHPRELTSAVLLSLAVGLGLSLAVTWLWAAPLWTATLVVLLALLPVGIRKWRQDLRAHGETVMWLSVLLTVQGVHTVEHLAQWVQYHVLLWPSREANGLLSPANAEWVHFTWNWLVLLVVVTLLVGGMRNPWVWLLLAVAFAHAVEHSYTFIRYQLILGELRGLGVVDVSAQGLPGILGRDGLLARSEWARGTFLCSLPGLTTATRLDLHFWWNALEIGLLAVGGHVFLRRLPAFSAPAEAPAAPSKPRAEERRPS
ncbi:MAG: hypothetical protein KatS3mg050_2311 [Litorilinea sp.]|nr:MAG: hypothetical protein KatS3mg050_2311 [Litorilinea sp.]